MSNLNTLIEQAFDYRGDVTLTLKDGRQIVGYLFNREVDGSSRCREPFVEIMPDDRPEKLMIRYAEIAIIAFTGKSGEEWLVGKKASGKT